MALLFVKMDDIVFSLLWAGALRSAIKTPPRLVAGQAFSPMRSGGALIRATPFGMPVD